MQYAIEAHGLYKNFGSLSAVRGVDICVAPGQIYGLVGPDGAGKTTMLRLLCGALRPGQGRVVIRGLDLATHLEQARAHIGYLSQRFSLYEDLTVLENIRFFAEVRSMPKASWLQRCMEILDFVGLADFKARLAGQLSGGMKQKLGLAAALVHQPAVLLLDEPTTGVDPVTRQDFWQLIIRLASQESIAMVVSTPYMDEAVRCQRIGFMRGGAILLEDTPTALLGLLDGRILEVSGSPLGALRSLAADAPAVEAVQAFGDRLHLRVKPGQAQAVAASLQRASLPPGACLEWVRPIPPELEDVFLALVES